jgi:Flp pilus assembly pilin Flp
MKILLIAAPSKETLRRLLGRCLITDRCGAVAIEYAIMGALVAVLAIAGLGLYGDSASGLWGWLSGEINGAMTD